MHIADQKQKEMSHKGDIIFASVCIFISKFKVFLICMQLRSCQMSTITFYKLSSTISHYLPLYYIQLDRVIFLQRN